MKHHRHAIMRGNPNPQQNNRARQDPCARKLFELLPDGWDDPHFRGVLNEITNLQSYGYRVTPEVVAEAVDRVKYRMQIVNMARPVKLPEQRSETTAQGTRRKIGRFTSVETPASVVYYMRIGNRVKIGTSTNLAQRLADINPEELLALEFGGKVKERTRHQQFDHLRTHGEWFRYEGALVEHVEAMKAQLAARETNLR